GHIHAAYAFPAGELNPLYDAHRVRGKLLHQLRDVGFRGRHFGGRDWRRTGRLVAVRFRHCYTANTRSPTTPSAPRVNRTTATRDTDSYSPIRYDTRKSPVPNMTGITAKSPSALMRRYPSAVARTSAHSGSGSSRGICSSRTSGYFSRYTCRCSSGINAT